MSVTIIDSMCGTGKTSWAIQLLIKIYTNVYKFIQKYR